MPPKYTFEQRKEWCEAYLKGEHVPTPLGAWRATFIRELKDWARKYKRLGPDSIDPSAKRKYYPIAVILTTASLVAFGEMSTKEAARQFGAKNKRTVRAWSRRYREGGKRNLPIHVVEGKLLRQQHNGIVLRRDEERNVLRIRGYL